MAIPKLPQCGIVGVVLVITNYLLCILVIVVICIQICWQTTWILEKYFLKVRLVIRCTRCRESFCSVPEQAGIERQIYLF